MPFDDYDQTYRPRLWKGLPIRCRDVPVAALRDALPDFELRHMGGPPHNNPRMRLIVRMPEDDDPYERPVAAVSDQYDLLQHRVVATWLAENVKAAGLTDAVASITTTEYGERLRVTVPLGDRDRSLDAHGMLDLLGEDDRYRPEIELTNSVDRSSAFRVVIRWRRLICLNGLWTTEEDRMRSVHHMAISRTREIQPFLEARLGERPDVLAQLRRWLTTSIDKSRAQRWCEERLRGRSGWSVKTCARLWAILATGYDGRVKAQSRAGMKHPLTAYHVARDRKVPGVPFPVKTAYDLAQILAWITSNQKTVEMQIEGTEEVPRLMRDFLKFR